MKNLISFLFYCLITNAFLSQSLPFYANFDDIIVQEGWQQYRSGFLSTYSWHYAVDGSPAVCVYHDYNVGGNPTDTVIDWFISPPINFSSTSTLTLKINTGGFTTPFPDSFEILFGTDQQNPMNGNFVVIANLSFMLPQYQWLDTTINIPFVSDNGYIAFKYKTIGAYWSTYAFDDISIISNSASLNEINTFKNDVIYFPNPFSEQTILQTDNLLIDATVNVINCFGQTVKQIKNINGKKVTLLRDNLPAGIYFVNIVQDNKTMITNKLIISN